MQQLPDYHIARPRLTDQCLRNAVVVVEAAAGYGKSVLAKEVCDALGAVGIEVLLDADVSADQLAARLRVAVLRAGYTDAARAAAEAGEDASAAVDGILHALARERCLFIVDDVHQALADAGALIARMASQLQADGHLLVLGRRLPDGAERLRRAEYLHLSSTELALTGDETLRLCREGFGLAVDAASSAVLDEAVGGWTAAAVLRAARAARTGEGLNERVERPRRTNAVEELLDEPMRSLPPEDRDALAQLARLAVLDPQLVEAVTGRHGLFDRALAAGIPFTRSGRGVWDLPGPVRDLLAQLAPPDPAAQRRAASELQRRGEHLEAIQLLLALGEFEAAAEAFDAVPPDIADAMTALELRTIAEQLPDAVVQEHPRVLLHHSLALRRLQSWDQSKALLDRAMQAAAARRDPMFERAAKAQEALYLIAALDTGGAELIARDVLAAATAPEKLTRAWAFNALGQARCGAIDVAGRRDVTALGEAEECFARATELFLEAGFNAVAASIAPYWAISIELASGRADAALRRLDRALTLTVDRPRGWGYVMTYKVVAAAELGDDELCRASAREVHRLAAQFDYELLWANGHWRLAYLTSYRGLAEETLDHVRATERHKAGWWGPASGDFLAESADLLDRVGYTALAWEYLERVRAEPKDAGYKVALAEAAIEARHGDPLLAELRVREAQSTRIDQREFWRLTLFLAHAALRRGDELAAGALAAKAFEEAASLGQEGLPLLRERELTEALLGLAVDTGQPAARALQAHTAPLALSILGRFELTEAGRPVPLRAAQEAQLLKLVAARGGRIASEQAIEAFWPEVDPEAGRHRLRTVLNRLRASAGALLAREGETLVLDPAVRVDYLAFLEEADRARSLAGGDQSVATAIARSALARYRGDLLPDDPYEQWSDAPRRRARGVALDLVQLCADEALERGDLDGLRRLVARSVEFAPDDDAVYARATSALLSAGRRGEALSIADRASSVFAELGLEPPSWLLDVRDAPV
jgi:DNA-binding SARP family transcriptional activator